MKIRLARQLWISLLLPIALALGTYGFVAREHRHRILVEEASAELRNHATLLEAAVAGAAQRGELPKLEQRVMRLARADRIQGIAVFDSAVRPLLATERVEGEAFDLSLVARQALSLGRDIEESRSLADGPALLRSVTLPSPVDGSPIVAVVVRDLAYVDELAATLDRGLVLTSALLVVFTALIAAVVSRHTVGRPVGDVVLGATRVASGDLDVRVPELGASEVASLARAFNGMTESLATARRRAEDDETVRVALERKLRHAQALAAVGQLAASMAHEIGSPLNVILGRAQRAAEDASCPPATREELATIARQCERISKVVKRLLDVARPPTDAGSTCNLVSVVDEVLAFLAPEAKRRGVITQCARPDEAIWVRLGADATFQVVCNLCMNAIEAQPRGGSLKLSIGVAIASAFKRGPGARAILDVTDRGPGISQDLAKRVFEPFFTTKSAAGGTGLGLAIASGIVTEVGGALRLVSSTSVGSRFEVELPLGAKEDAPS